MTSATVRLGLPALMAASASLGYLATRLPLSVLLGLGLAAVLGAWPVHAAMHRRARLIASLRAGLRESEARYRLLADNSTDIVIGTDAEGTIRFVSPSILRQAHHQPGALLGTGALTLIAPEHRARVARAHADALAAPGKNVPVEFLGQPGHGGPRWFEASVRAIGEDGGARPCVICVIRDMSARKEVETALALAALTDPLTGLPNRRLFVRAMEACIAAGKPACVALIDLDHFKRVNDTHGHAAGDEVLKTFARVAREGLRGSDTLARIGGEEFALLLPGASLDIGEMICGRLGARLSQAITEHAGARIAITSSIGLARLGRDADAALAQADRALYEAKAAGRDRLSVAA